MYCSLISSAVQVSPYQTCEVKPVLQARHIPMYQAEWMYEPGVLCGYAQIDEEDELALMKHVWMQGKPETAKHTAPFRFEMIRGQGWLKISLPKILLGIPIVRRSGWGVLHIDGDRWNNKKENLVSLYCGKPLVPKVPSYLCNFALPTVAI